MKLGSVVYYRHPTVEAIYPAIVTVVEDEGLGLTVFTLGGQLFPTGVAQGEEPGCWRASVEDDVAPPPAKFGNCGRCQHPARSHPEDHGRRCVEPGCGCMAWQQVEEELGGVKAMVIVPMSPTSSRDPQHLLVPDGEDRLRIAEADVLVAVWPDGDHRMLKDGGGLHRGFSIHVVKDPQPGSLLSAAQFARAFLGRYGKQRQAIDEELLVEWFEAALAGGEIPRARP